MLEKFLTGEFKEKFSKDIRLDKFKIIIIIFLYCGLNIFVFSYNIFENLNIYFLFLTSLVTLYLCISIYEKRLYYDIATTFWFYSKNDKFGLLTLIIGMCILILAYPLHSFLITFEILQNDLFIDKFAGVALILFMISEFRLQNITNESYELYYSKKEDISRKVDRINFKNSLNFCAELHIKVLTNKIKKMKEPKKFINNFLEKRREEIKDEVIQDIEEEVIIEFNREGLKPFHTMIHILIIFSTLIVTFGFLIKLF